MIDDLAFPFDNTPAFVVIIFHEEGLNHLCHLSDEKLKKQ